MNTPLSGRHFLRSTTAASMLFPGIVQQLLADAGDATNPLAPRAPHFQAKAKNVIFLFMTGGVRHIDTFDPKPELVKSHGKEIPSDHPTTKGRDSAFMHWKKAVANVKVHDMPPEDAPKQPTDEERRQFTEWIGQLKYLSPRNPGPFVIRRLTRVDAQSDSCLSAVPFHHARR